MIFDGSIGHISFCKETKCLIYRFYRFPTCEKSTHPCSSAGRHDVPVFGAADVGVVLHAQVVADLMSHHIH